MAESRVSTPDGERLKVEQLNIGDEANAINSASLKGRIAGFFRAISLFLAGMYTGVGCSGTPRRYHEYSADNDDGPV